MVKQTTPVVWAGVAAAFGLVVIMAVAEQTRLDVWRALQAVSHTLDVQKAFNLVLKGVLDGETGRRGFLLTWNEAYLSPYRGAQGSMASHLDSLASLTANDAHHRARVAERRTLVTQKMGELRGTIEAAERGDRAGALAMVKSERGRLLMERTRLLLDAAFVDEQRFLRERQALLDEALFRRAMLTYVLGLVLALVIIGAVRLRARLRRLEPLVTLCAWSKTVQDGDEWVSFEEYLHRRFGLRVTHGLSPSQLEKLAQELPPSA
jgi:methyl-accepting chemotaxis protein